ncbi:MAG TPA: metallophosphoesterase [Chthoniobacteraceae bacterium]|nr:metallophosphoesterase [Chthoniobacteraceae bacterium]
MSDYIEQNLDRDGIDRRGFLKCMAWAGTGAAYFLSGGVLRSASLSDLAARPALTAKDLLFVQISDSHIGFNKEANPDVVGTLRAAIDKINALPVAPAFMLHTGDLSHLSKPSEFDTLDEVLKSAKAGPTFFVPGEHDVLEDNGAQYRERYGKKTLGDGWYSFDSKGVHFIGLVNVMNLKPGGLGSLGREQLEWLEKDVAHLKNSTPIVVFAHVPLWSVYPQWGWGTDDSAQALGYLKRFGSVSVLNGHIHQVLQKVEGNVTFHTAMSTAFPQPAPGSAPSPGPMKVEAAKLRSLLGLSGVTFIAKKRALAVIDEPLAATAPEGQSAQNQIGIDNFTFAPAALSVARGATVTWVNHDDIPHKVAADDKRFVSKVLDTNEQFSTVFDTPGTFGYYCTIHPHMTGRIVVK